MCNTKKIQVPVIIGTGNKQTLVVETLTVAPPAPPIFRIIDIDKKVIITDKKVIPGTEFMAGKVIINGYIDKNIIYKTLPTPAGYPATGPIQHYTTLIPFSTFVEIDDTVIPQDKVLEGDECEILEAFVEGERNELLDPLGTDPETYATLLEKDLVRIVVKIVRVEHLDVIITH